MYYKITKQWFISPTMYGEEDPIMNNLLKLKNSGK
jgi:transcription antitermination factor NusG